MSAYRRVATSDQSDEGAGAAAGRIVGGQPSDDPASSPRRGRSERISDKLHALVWVVVAIGVSWYTRLFATAFGDDRIVRPLFRAALALFSANAVLTLYLTVYLPRKFPVTATHKTPASSPAFWEAYCPRAIPAMTGCGVVGSCLLVRACYPVYGFLTPFILGVVALGMFFSLHFIPWC